MKLSGKEDGLAIYNIFKGRGGNRRLLIMESLKVARMRNEIAKITNTDWKEVDRNIRILCSFNLVKTDFVHGSFSVYEMTERGKEILRIIETVLEGDSKNNDE